MHVIGTAGHVDHGKSTLVQRLTGIDPDRFAEEKRRGLTIDLGFAWLPLPSGNEIGIIDVPGHERFIKNMLAGAGGISVCLFVLAANEGWMPQSTEHLAILDTLGIDSGVVALTKSDTVDEETVELARAEAEENLDRTSLAGAPVIAVSAVTGQGIEELVSALDDAVAGAPAPVDKQRPRLWVDRVFSISGAGTVVTGTLAGGTLESGSEVEISPEGRRARVRSIQSHKRDVAAVGPANRVALNLAGLERQGAERGDAVVRAGQWRPSRTIDAHIRVLPEWAVGADHVLREKGSHLLYVGSAETPVRIKLFGATSLRADDEAFAQLHLRDALPLSRGDRFVLRDAGRMLSFGGGVVLDPLAHSTRRTDEARPALLEALAHASEEEAVKLLVEAEGTMPVSDALLRSGAVSVPLEVHRFGSVLMSDARYDDTEAKLRDAIAGHHRDRPLERGMPREAARAATGLDGTEFEAFVTTVAEVEPDGATLRLVTHAVAMSSEQNLARDAVVEEIEGRGFTPPLAKELDADPALLRALTEAGELVRIGDFFLTAALAADARTRVRRAIESEGPLTVAQIRDLLGTSRKYAVPLCEWLDYTGATLRRGDTRILGPQP